MNSALWFLLGLILGLVVAFVIGWFLWRRRVEEREARILSLQGSLREKEEDLRVLNAHLQEQKATVGQLQDQVSEGERTISALVSELEEVKEAASRLRLAVEERDGQIEGLKVHVEEARAEVERLAGLLQEKEAALLRAGPLAGLQDNLELIEGIGPKISQLLQEAGITTFAQLAATDASRLVHILREANLPMIDPRTWPEQARLAADGKWDALKALQDELKGGRRV